MTNERINHRHDRHDELAAMSNEELFEELTLWDFPEDLWHELGIRLGISGVDGVRVENVWMPEAERLRQYRQRRIDPGRPGIMDEKGQQ
jgi:hypothetical protein